MVLRGLLQKLFGLLRIRESFPTESSDVITTLLLEALADTAASAQQLSPTIDDGIHQIITLCNSM